MTDIVSTTAPSDAKISRVFDNSDTWIRGHRKSDNRPFFVISSSDGSRVYWTDTRSCTCPDHTGRGRTCKHMASVQMLLARENADRRSIWARVAKPGGTRVAWCASGCGLEVNPAFGQDCNDCAEQRAWADYDRRQRAEEIVEQAIEEGRVRDAAMEKARAGNAIYEALFPDAIKAGS